MQKTQIQIQICQGHETCKISKDIGWKQCWAAIGSSSQGDGEDPDCHQCSGLMSAFDEDNDYDDDNDNNDDNDYGDC